MTFGGFEGSSLAPPKDAASSGSGARLRERIPRFSKRKFSYGPSEDASTETQVVAECYGQFEKHAKWRNAGVDGPNTTGVFPGRVGAASAGADVMPVVAFKKRSVAAMDGLKRMELELQDGRTLEVLVAGSSGMPLVFHYGTPCAAVPYTPLFEAASTRGLQTVVYSRPGYAGSTAKPGRSVAEAAADVVHILDTLDASMFATVGWSGGGPHALACAALLPDRCVAAATIASVAPYNVEGLDWLAGMGPENIEEYSAAARGEAVLTPYLEAAAVPLANVQGPDVAAALGSLVSDVDKAALTGEFAEFTAAMLRAGVSKGIAGWRDDDLAFVRNWGFNLTAVRPPIAVWHGGNDRMVPYAHGVWLANHIPGARVHLESSEGHLSLAVGSLNRILDDLLEISKDRPVATR